MTLLDYVLKVDVEFAQHIFEERGDLSFAASYAAVEAFGHQSVKDNPQFQLIAELSIALGSKPEVYRVTLDAMDTISMIVIKHQPVSTPTLMHKALIIEIVKSDTNSLFKGITDLGMYPIDHGFMLIGLDRRKEDPKIIESRWIPAWAKRTMVSMDSGPAYWNMYYQLDEWARGAARFILTLALLKETKNHPFSISNEKIKIGNRNDRNQQHSGLVVHTIEIDGEVKNGSLEQIERKSNRLAPQWNYTILGTDSEGSK